MASTRSGESGTGPAGIGFFGRGPLDSETIDGRATGMEPNLLAAAEWLRWTRPDLTEALARHVLDEAVTDDDHGRWLVAAGWLVCACSATGDGRLAATEVLGRIAAQSGSSLMGQQDSTAEPPAHRLRVELAVIAAAAGEVPLARLLLAPITIGSVDAELRGDAYAALARCSAQDRPDEVGEALLHASVAWSEVTGPRGAVGAATVALVAAAAERRAGRAADAVAHAAEGLAELDRGRGDGVLVRSDHVAAALAAEWIAALLDAGRAREAREGCELLAFPLAETARASRQTVRLRLSVARAVAADPDYVAQVLDRAARDAVDCDAPDLEAACRSASGALFETTGRLDAALDAFREAVAAQDRSRGRDAGFVTALREVMALRPLDGGARPVRSPSFSDGGPRHADAGIDDPHGPAVADRGRATGSTGEPVGGDRRNPAAGLLGPAQDTRAGQDPAVDRSSGGSGDVDRPGRLSAATVRAAAGGCADDAELRQVSAVETAASGPTWSEGLSGTSPWGDDGPIADAPIGDALARSLAPADEVAVGTLPGATGDRAGRDLGPAGPWSTGSWAAAAKALVPDVPAAEVPAAPDAESWLHADLAELDRVWGVAECPAGPARQESAGDHDAADHDAADHDAADHDAADHDAADHEPEGAEQATDGCVVVIDVARRGRRFAGRRAGAVVRAVADRLADRLPDGAHVSVERTEALSVVVPGWGRSPATEWMHRMLPGILEGVAAADQVPGAHLRAAVCDADGPVGAQILQPIGIGVGHGSERSAAVHAPAACSDSGRDGSAEGAPGRDDGTPAQDQPGTGAAPARGGRHDAAGRMPFRLDGQVIRPGSGGRRFRRGAEGHPPSASAVSPALSVPATPSTAPSSAVPKVDPASVGPAPTEGLGLADLLAGALAVYRGI